MARDDNFQNPAFGVDDEGNVSILKADNATGKILVKVIADSTVPGKQSPVIDSNYHTDIVVDNNDDVTALVANSEGHLFVTGTNLNVI